MNKIIFILLIFSIQKVFSNKIGITSIPKCGTFLLVKCIELLRQQKCVNIDGTHLRKLENITKTNFFYCHLAYSPAFEIKLKQAKFKMFFIYRDPRDQIVSNAYWMKKLYVGYKNQTIDQIMTMLIKTINLLYEPYLKWLDNEISCPIKFENLIGLNGGGSQKLQRKEINKIARNLEINSKKLKNNCIKNLFGESPTFREGKIGSWKQHFSEDQKELFKKIAGNLLIRLGYETDHAW